jgi:hypothetical protein
MATNSVDAVLINATNIEVYANLLSLHLDKKDDIGQLQIQSIIQLAQDIATHTEIMRQHLIDRENTIESLKSTFTNFNDELDYDEYESTTNTASSTKSSRGAKTGKVNSHTNYPPPAPEVEKEEVKPPINPFLDQTNT